MLERTAVRIIFFILLSGLSACARGKPGPEDPAKLLGRMEQRLCWVSAHRGDRDAGVDNSLKAIESAASAGVPLVEIDLRVIDGGGIYLFHDDKLSATNYAGPGSLLGRRFSSLTPQELASITLPRSGGAVPSFGSALALIGRFPSLLQLDLKGESPEMVGLVLHELDLLGARGKVVIQCQRKSCLESLKKEPDILVLARAHEPEHLSDAMQARPAIVQTDLEWTDGDMIREIHAIGSRILTKSLGPTLDYPEIWKKVFQMGIDIQMTDHPLAMKQVIPNILECVEIDN
jgi:glycerophosphoryl diester phosphodiesterase